MWKDIKQYRKEVWEAAVEDWARLHDMIGFNLALWAYPVALPAGGFLEFTSLGTWYLLQATSYACLFALLVVSPFRVWQKKGTNPRGLIFEFDEGSVIEPIVFATPIDKKTGELKPHGHSYNYYFPIRLTLRNATDRTVENVRVLAELAPEMDSVAHVEGGTPAYLQRVGGPASSLHADERCHFNLGMLPEQEDRTANVFIPAAHIGWIMHSGKGMDQDYTYGAMHWVEQQPVLVFVTAYGGSVGSERILLEISKSQDGRPKLRRMKTS